MYIYIYIYIYTYIQRPVRIMRLRPTIFSKGLDHTSILYLNGR